MGGKDVENKLIPIGMYCYVFDLTSTSKEENSIPVVCCPYRKTKNINGVNVPWCNHLNKGGVSNYITDDDHKKLEEYYGSVDNIYDNLTLDLLWDDVKECGKNYGDLELDVPQPKEEIIEWINLVREFQKNDR